jgi:Mg-chelatase subunit ChlD
MAGMAPIVFQNPWALSLALPLAWLLLIAYSWRRRYKPFGPFLLRLAIIVLISLALSQPTVLREAPEDTREPSGRVVVLVDQSASLGVVGQQRLRAEAAQLTQGLEDAFVLFFADRPILVADSLGTTLAAQLTGPYQGEALDPTITNLADALRLGVEFLNHQPGRLILLSDGLPTVGDTLAIANQLAQQDVPVDVLIPGEVDIQVWQNGRNEVQLVNMTVPPVLRSGETFDIEVMVHSEASTDVTLNVSHSTGKGVLAEDEIRLEAGLNRFTFNTIADEVGPHTFRATLDADNDRYLENNTFSAFTQVYPTPLLLIVTDERVAASRFSRLLQGAGFETDIMRPAQLPVRLSELETYAGMTLLNVSAESLELEQMIAIQEFVRSLGRGLVVTGGLDSYDLGHYEDTPLAELLPLSLEPPPRKERPPVALLLIIDHSGSMTERREPATRLTMAKEAAIRATDILGAEDLIGVLMFDNRYAWVVPFQQVSDGAELLNVQQRIARIPGGGGTRILQALEVGLSTLIEQDEAVARLAVLLSDGKSFDGQKTIEDYNLIVDQALEANITFSAIAIGTGADEDLLSYLAERGRGRYHFAEVPEELPALTISESDILRTNAMQTGDFKAAVPIPHPLLRGLFAPGLGSGRNEAPSLSGYLAMTPKPQAEVALQIGPGDPLLSVWGYGLGRVVAWSSDAGNDWTRTWRDWPEFSRFWGQVIGYTLPAPNLALLQLEVTIEPDGTLILAADGVTPTGQPVDLTPTQAILITPGDQQRSFRLQQVAPGRYERRLRLTDPGAYQLTVNQIRSDGPDETTTSGFVLPYPAEYGLPAPDSGRILLEQIAAVTGGRTFIVGQSMQPGVPTLDVDDDLLTEPLELWPWFLQIVLVLWPLEIAWRRWSRLRIQ